MSKKHETKLNNEDLTDPEIHEAIRYLEPDSQNEKKYKDDTVLVIGFSIVIFFLGILGFMCLFYR